MLKNIAAITTSLICLSSLSVAAHTGTTAELSDNSSFEQSPDFGFFSPEQEAEISGILDGLEYELAAPVVKLPGDAIMEFDCVCAGGNAAAAGAAIMGGAIGFAGTGGNPVGGIVGEAIGAGVGIGVHEGYHHLENQGPEPGVEHIELEGMRIQAD